MIGLEGDVPSLDLGDVPHPPPPGDDNNHPLVFRFVPPKRDIQHTAE